MPGAYIPPHLRKKSESSSKPEDVLPPTPRPTNGHYRLDEINNYFWPDAEDDDSDGGHGTFSEPKGKTLHSSANTPDKLAYVILYWDANRRWDEGIIFTKSNLDILPRSLTDPSPDGAEPGTEVSEKSATAKSVTDVSENDVSDPVAVFKQTFSKRHTNGYEFEGWYKVERVAFLESFSQDLVRMLEQKWTKTHPNGVITSIQRDGSDWQRSLSRRWAVVKLAKNEAAQKDRGSPKIERLPEPVPLKARTPSKSVNEMLAELRMKDSKKDDTSADD